MTAAGVYRPEGGLMPLEDFMDLHGWFCAASAHGGPVVPDIRRWVEGEGAEDDLADIAVVI